MIEDRYRQVCRTLQEYTDRLQSAREKQIQLQNYYRELVEKAEKEHQAELEENAGKAARVRAFLGMAQAHTGSRVPATSAQPYDNGALSRLAVQIGSGASDDRFAAELYTRADGQLRYLEGERSGLEAQYADKMKRLEAAYQKNRNQLLSEAQRQEAGLRDTLRGREFSALLTALRGADSLFAGKASGRQAASAHQDEIALGTQVRPLPLPESFRSLAGEVSGGLYDPAAGGISGPYGFPAEKGFVLLAEYDNGTEKALLSGLQNLVLNLARYRSGDYSRVYFVDPIRYNASSLGCLAELCGGRGALLEPVATSAEDLRAKLKGVMAEIGVREMQGAFAQRPLNCLFVFHSFPQSYDAQAVAQIQQLCASAEHYGISVVLTSNLSWKAHIISDSLEMLKPLAIRVPEGLRWYEAPSVLPADIRERYVLNRPVTDMSNDYARRVGIKALPEYRKGRRALKGIPYGVDMEGQLQTLDFEDSNFATFVCGASRSGKSTLLHTLITGFLEQLHPDDIEVWLIDFKMTEFSRYIRHLPPHVRYIILDESPELVYDIIDRLTEILQKRQNVFKGKWQKLSDVPGEKYMPAMLVIIDEFSVMSQILADSALTGKENYTLKLQTLLAKGAALGMHFIFASQGFTSGTRGLNDFSKKQIQQRIAMKTEYAEIRETLDLKSTSDADKMLMEQLQPHYALTRVPVDERGNHLRQSHVLYIADYLEQEDMIDGLNRDLVTTPKFRPEDPGSYISKQPVIIDGNSYAAFGDKRPELQAFLRSNAGQFAETGETAIFVGEARRLRPVQPILLSDEFAENLLLLAPASEKMAACSILLTMAESLGMQGEDMELWSAKKNPLYRQLRYECKRSFAECTDLGSICRRIHEWTQDVRAQRESRRYVVITGAESLLTDMSFQTGTAPSRSSEAEPSAFEKRKVGEADLLTQLTLSLNGLSTRPAGQADTGAGRTQAAAAQGDAGAAYDAREDLKYLLKNGPRLGYHFLLHFSSAGDLVQSRIDPALFKHKLLFRIPRSEASGIVGSGNAAVFAELEDRSFRYSDGLDGISFRPYLHPGLSWDGWHVSEGEDAAQEEEEEEYLM